MICFTKIAHLLMIKYLSRHKTLHYLFHGVLDIIIFCSPFALPKATQKGKNILSCISSIQSYNKKTFASCRINIVSFLPLQSKKEKTLTYNEKTAFKLSSLF